MNGLGEDGRRLILQLLGESVGDLCDLKGRAEGSGRSTGFGVLQSSDPNCTICDDVLE